MDHEGSDCGSMEAESPERDDWKAEAFQGQGETQCQGNSQESTEMTPAKTPTNSRYIALTGHLL